MRHAQATMSDLLLHNKTFIWILKDECFYHETVVFNLNTVIFSCNSSCKIQNHDTGLKSASSFSPVFPGFFVLFFFNFRVVVQEFFGNFPFFLFSGIFSLLFRNFQIVWESFQEIQGFFLSKIVWNFRVVIQKFSFFLFFFWNFFAQRFSGFYSSCHSGILRNFHLVFRVILGLSLEIFLQVVFQVVQNFCFFFLISFFTLFCCLTKSYQVFSAHLICHIHHA